jgi:hypothetical protein
MIGYSKTYDKFLLEERTNGLDRFPVEGENLKLSKELGVQPTTYIYKDKKFFYKYDLTDTPYDCCVLYGVFERELSHRKVFYVMPSEFWLNFLEETEKWKKQNIELESPNLPMHGPYVLMYASTVVIYAKTYREIQRRSGQLSLVCRVFFEDFFTNEENAVYNLTHAKDHEAATYEELVKKGLKSGDISSEDAKILKIDPELFHKFRGTIASKKFNL